MAEDFSKTRREWLVSTIRSIQEHLPKEPDLLLQHATFVNNAVQQLFRQPRQQSREWHAQQYYLQRRQQIQPYPLPRLTQAVQHHHHTLPSPQPQALPSVQSQPQALPSTQPQALPSTQSRPQTSEPQASQPHRQTIYSHKQHPQISNQNLQPLSSSRQPLPSSQQTAPNPHSRDQSRLQAKELLDPRQLVVNQYAQYTADQIALQHANSESSQRQTHQPSRNISQASDLVQTTNPVPKSINQIQHNELRPSQLVQASNSVQEPHLIDPLSGNLPISQPIVGEAAVQVARQSSVSNEPLRAETRHHAHAWQVIEDTHGRHAAAESTQPTPASRATESPKTGRATAGPKTVQAVRATESPKTGRATEGPKTGQTNTSQPVVTALSDIAQPSDPAINYDSDTPLTKIRNQKRKASPLQAPAKRLKTHPDCQVTATVTFKQILHGVLESVQLIPRTRDAVILLLQALFTKKNHLNVRRVLHEFRNPAEPPPGPPLELELHDLKSMDIIAQLQGDPSSVRSLQEMYTFYDTFQPPARFHRDLVGNSGSQSSSIHALFIERYGMTYSGLCRHLSRARTLQTILSHCNAGLLLASEPNLSTILDANAEKLGQVLRLVNFSHDLDIFRELDAESLVLESRDAPTIAEALQGDHVLSGNAIREALHTAVTEMLHGNVAEAVQDAIPEGDAVPEADAIPEAMQDAIPQSLSGIVIAEADDEGLFVQQDEEFSIQEELTRSSPQEATFARRSLFSWRPLDTNAAKPAKQSQAYVKRSGFVWHPSAKDSPMQDSFVQSTSASSSRESPVSHVQSTASPSPVQEFTALPAPFQKSTASPTPVQEFTVLPAPFQKSTASPTPVQESAATPTPVQESAATPTPVQESTASPIEDASPLLANATPASLVGKARPSLLSASPGRRQQSIPKSSFRQLMDQYYSKVRAQKAEAAIENQPSLDHSVVEPDIIEHIPDRLTPHPHNAEHLGAGNEEPDNQLTADNQDQLAADNQERQLAADNQQQLASADTQLAFADQERQLTSELNHDPVSPRKQKAVSPSRMRAGLTQPSVFRSRHQSLGTLVALSKTMSPIQLPSLALQKTMSTEPVQLPSTEPVRVGQTTPPWKNFGQRDYDRSW